MPNRFSGNDTERSALEAYIKLWRAAQAVETAANRHLSDHGLTLSQFAVLEALYHLGPLSQRQLADKILRSSGNLTMVIDNLERDHQVSRERNPADRRAFQISLTDAGRNLIERILPGHVRGIQALFSVLEPDEVQQLSALTRRLGLEARRQDAERSNSEKE
ncbi:MarR family winged helix-turn-helix transcriptional regulator [Deinococcus humi]|uniref:MarR family 2-MHQ and catechol resistance regulon transcriptional repressor n=1 Tax=Deinococcus humi TaxID=662880 RepID=A0A7W8JPS9_9DEIO|nr:MarR family transcriptional regulator [Deinococcus humi]MBB5360965.1 MarR family 2-MHQ and catechol resistance regulon transcriptional repressor [Deinococcus humi]GGO17817.1 MarR family transcriptional regulator [Deinococcus humi]